MESKIIKRTTSPQCLQPYLLKMEFVSELVGVHFTWIVDKCRNYGFHYEMRLSIIVEGTKDAIDNFDKMIEETETKTVK